MNLPFLAQAAMAPAASADDIRDIRGPVAVPSSWGVLVAVLSVLALALLAWGAWTLWKRRAKPLPPPDPLTVALDALQSARSLMRPETAREFSTAVSQAVRSYIEARFGARFEARAAHLTTEEFLHGLTNRPDSPLSAYRPLLNDFLSHCDRAKFGRWASSEAEMEAMWQSARGFLADAGAKPEPAGEDEA